MRSPYRRRCRGAGPGHPPFGRRVTRASRRHRPGPSPTPRPWSASIHSQCPPHSPRISVASPTGQQWRIGHGRQEVVVCEVGATLRAYTVGQTPVARRFRRRRVVPLGPGPGPGPVAQPPGRRALRVQRGAGPGRPGRARAPQRHPRPGALDALDAPDPAPEPALAPAAAPPLARVPVLPPARDRVPRGPRAASPSRPGPSRSRRARSPSASASTPTSTAGPETVDGAILHVPARHTLDVDDRGLPTGALDARRGHRSRLHHAALRRARRARHGLHHPRTRRRRHRPGPASMRREASAAPPCGWTPASPTSWCTRATRWARCNAGAAAVAIEPMTCPPNALRTGTDVIALAARAGVDGPLGDQPR